MITDPKIKRIDRRLTRAYNKVAKVSPANGRRVPLDDVLRAVHEMMVDISDLIDDMRSDDV